MKTSVRQLVEIAIWYWVGFWAVCSGHVERFFQHLFITGGPQDWNNQDLTAMNAEAMALREAFEYLEGFGVEYDLSEIIRPSYFEARRILDEMIRAAMLAKPTFPERKGVVDEDEARMIFTKTRERYITENNFRNKTTSGAS